MSVLHRSDRRGQVSRGIAALLCVLLALSGAVLARTQPKAGAKPSVDTNFPRVFSRVPRTQGPLPVELKAGGTLNVQHPDLYDVIPGDVSFLRAGFSAPGQLVLRTAQGKLVVLYDCMKRTPACVPMDVAVHPDGSKALFSVYRGKGWNYPRKLWPNKPGSDAWLTLMAKGLEAQMYEVSLRPPYKVTAFPHTPGTYDTGPVYRPAGGILFMSDRPDAKGRRAYPPVLRRLNPTDSGTPITRMWVLDASGARLVGHADMSGSIHPIVLKDGTVAVSQRIWNHLLPYRATNGAYNGTGTLSNLWIPWCYNQEGGNQNACGFQHEYQSALHDFGQLSSGEFAVSHYYRGNNNRLGDIWGWMPEAIDVEGRSAREARNPDHFLRPRTYRTLTPWSNGNDKHPDKEGGQFTGKVGMPEGLPDGQMMLTLGKGLCIALSGTLESFDTVDLAGQDVACDTQIAMTTVIPSRSVSDLVILEGDPKWHEFGARYAGRYQDVHGVPAPSVQVHSDAGACRLRMASMQIEEHPNPFQSAKPYKRCGMERCQLDGGEDVAAVRFYQVQPNRAPPAKWDKALGWTSTLNSWGYPVQGAYADVPVAADGSAYVEVPCETPLIMTGVDKSGAVINRDQMPMSMRPGESRACGGCHFHSGPGKRFEGTVASKQAPVRLGKLRPVPTWRDVKPYLERHCKSCHVKDAWMWDYANLVWDYRQESRTNKTQLRSRGRKYWLDRPNTSAYVDAAFARSSLLFWKCMGKRLDNHSDRQFEGDIDFGKSHPAFKGCELIRDWLDAGANG